MYNQETEAARARRIRNGRLALIISIAWWIISIGGIILVINLNA